MFSSVEREYACVHLSVSVLMGGVNKLRDRAIAIVRWRLTEVGHGVQVRAR